MMIAFVIFLINLYDLILATKWQLNVDPISIRVDPKLYRLCWDQINTSKFEYINASVSSSKEISLAVFSDPHQSNRTFCVERIDKHSLYSIKFPIMFYSKLERFEILVNFSVKLSPSWDIIRTQIVPSGIHFHLNSEFAGMSKNYPICKVLLLFATSKSKDMIQFEMDSHRINNNFIKLEKGSKYIFYYSCHQFTFVQTSSMISSETGTTFGEEKTLPLKPFIQIPFRKFIIALWKNPTNVPNSYVVLIRDDKGRCVKKFRIMKKSFIKPNQKPEFEEKSCRSKMKVVDLGFYKGSQSGRIKVILNMEKFVKLDIRYKFSIFWKDLDQKVQENFIFFTFLPNENCATVNPKFMNPNLTNYDELRNQNSNFHQILMSENRADPITEEHINASGYNDALIVPAVSESDAMMIQVIQSETRVNMVNKCNSSPECNRGFFPFFYSLFTIRHKQDINTEIIEIPRSIVKTVKITNVELKSNNNTSTFQVSWSRPDSIETISPSSYLLEIKSLSPEKCHLACIIKCKTCSEVYKKGSLKNNYINILLITSKCKENQTIEDSFNVVDNYVSFETLKLPTSVPLIGSLYAIEFQSIIGPIVSSPSILPDIPRSKGERSINKTLIIALATGSVTILLIIFIGLILCSRKPVRNIKNNINLNQVGLRNYYDEDSSNKYDDGEN